MSENFSIPSAKLVKALLEGAASSLQKKGKRKRLPLADTRVVYDLEAYKLSKANVTSAPTKARMPPTSVSTKLSLAK